MEKHPLHIKTPELQTSPEVRRAVDRQERQTGEKVPNDPALRIEAYLNRLEQLILDPKQEQEKKGVGDILHTERPRALSLLREMILNEYVRPNKEKMAEGAAMVEERAARQMGIQVEYGADQLQQRGEIAAGDLESSLDQWITYLSNPNEPYPAWFRYYAFKNILNLGEFDKDKQEFPKRSKGTFKLFPDVDRGALAYIQETMEAAQDDTVLNRIREAHKTLWNTPDQELLTKEKAKAFASLSFAKQYAEGIKQNGEISPELRAETKGEWVHYKKGDDPKELWLSLQNKGTAWCTKGYPTAKTQLGAGDFYVYYTLDSTGKPAIPRIAIRMEGDKKIAENPRGVFDSQQNLEPNMAPILEEKLKEFGPEADKFKKKSEDMKKVTELVKKQESKEPFSKADLTFLYELSAPIEGFGYGRDQRIRELRSKRNPKEDVPIVFDCIPEEIAWKQEDVNEKTAVYIGQWSSGTYERIKVCANIRHLYEQFPEKKIFMMTLETDPHINSPEKAEKALRLKNIRISDYGKDILYKTNFSKEKQTYSLVQFTAAELGFSQRTTINEIYKRAEELGLELCSAEVGPLLRLQYEGRDSKLIAMNQLTDFVHTPRVFYLGENGGLLELSAHETAYRQFDSSTPFVFRLRKKLSSSES